LPRLPVTGLTSSRASIAHVAHSPPATPSLQPFVVDLTGFNGPLDLLLSLIRDEQVDIYDIPVARICEQFLARMHELQLNEAAEYLEMAARSSASRRRCCCRERKGATSGRIRAPNWCAGCSSTSRCARSWTCWSGWARTAAPALRAPISASRPPRHRRRSRSPSATCWSRWTACCAPSKRPTIHEVIPRALDVDGAMQTVRAILQLRAHTALARIVRDDAEPWEVLSALLGLLELGKRNEVHLTQPRPFADVEIRRESAGEAA
jgi:segregation and condensation protein A